MPLEVGSIVEGRVKSIAPFGAFVDLPEKEYGLVHISEIAQNYVQDIREHINIGDKVKVMVLSTDKGKINLSIKKALNEQEKKSIRPVDVDWGRSKDSKMSFEDMLSKFKQESDEKISILKSSKDSKRSRSVNPY